MNGFVYIGADKIGRVDFQMIDASMGAIGGYMYSDSCYEKYKKEVQALYDIKGSANSEDFDFKISINNKILDPKGGICVTDAEQFNEIYVDAAGLCLEAIGFLIA